MASADRPDGASIAYYVRDGVGPNLVLIPGSWGDHHVFDRVVEALPRSFRVVIVELRGHGRSQPPSSDPSMRSLADDVLAVVDRLGLARFHVGGHSIGGMLAVEIAGLRPGAVAGAIAMEGWTHHQVARDAFPNDSGGTANRERILKTMSAAEMSAFASVWRRWDGLPILRATPVRVLEIWGDRGRPRPSRELMRIPDRSNIELAWIAGASHSMLVERPGEVARLVAAFVGH